MLNIQLNFLHKRKKKLSNQGRECASIIKRGVSPLFAPKTEEGGFISMRSPPKQKPFHMHCFSYAAVICLALCIPHPTMLIFRRDNFSTISTPVTNRNPFMGRTPGSCKLRQVKQWPDALREPVSAINTA